MSAEFEFADEMADDAINVYLAGPLSDYDDAPETHDRIKNTCHIEDVNFVDPLKLEPEFASGWEMIRKDLGAVEDVDAVFVYWPGRVESWGTMAEIHHALGVSTPVVIWSMNGESHNHWKTLPFTVETELETAIEALVATVRLRA